MPSPLSRRAFVATLAGWFSVIGLGRGVAAPRDAGIGGTGASSDPEEPASDRGIGGTGVVGTIRRFGSIVVNHLRISYPAHVAVTIDDEPGAVADLRVGHVVRTTARLRRGTLATTAIAVASEVVGPVESVSRNELVVMGQRVMLATADDGWREGDKVAVSGLRRADGAVMSSLVERRPAGRSRVIGVPKAGPDGTISIAGLTLRGLDPSLVGQRCIVEGRYTDRMLDVVAARDEQTLLLASRPRRLSIEAYLVPNADGVELGSGLRVGRAPSGFATAAETRAVLTVVVGRRGALAVAAVHPEPRTSATNGTRNAPVAPGSDKARSRPGGPAPGLHPGAGKPQGSGSARPGSGGKPSGGAR